MSENIEMRVPQDNLNLAQNQSETDVNEGLPLQQYEDLDNTTFKRRQIQMMALCITKFEPSFAFRLIPE
jgi:hypothetical protein